MWLVTRRHPDLDTLDPDKWIVVEDAHPAIVSKEVWETANARRKGPAPGRRMKTQVPYLLSGIIRCARCGFHFQGQSTRAKGRNYYRYVCSGYNTKRVCSYTAVGRDGLEEFVLEAIHRTLADPKFSEGVLHHLKQLRQCEPDGREIELQRIREALKANDEKMSHITSALELGGQMDVLVARLRALETERAGLLAERERLQHQDLRYREIEETREAVEAFVQSFSDLLCDPCREALDCAGLCGVNPG